jgi:V/A-type H+-transporting ATPase subunit I
MAPVELKNPMWLKPFESVTNLYGTPKPTDIDPTPLLAPFFALFFGLCLTDAGYGLVLAVVMGLYLLKTRQSIEEGKLWWLLFVGGILTFFISIPFGGWFGLLPDQAPAWLTETRTDGLLWFKGQIWNLGETKGIAFFQNLSLVLGLFHLSFGIFLAGFCKWRAGQKAAAFWIDWTSLILFAAIASYFFVAPEQQQNALYAIYASLVLLLWGKGYGNPWYSRFLYGLIGFFFLATGMLGNTLSYLRLLALGLVTGALALAVNLVAQQIGALFPPVIGLPIAITIYVVGHTANVALNTLGAFIHSGRLQFVEFFGNFFEGGGKKFSPFSRSRSL